MGMGIPGGGKGWGMGDEDKHAPVLRMVLRGDMFFCLFFFFYEGREGGIDYRGPYARTLGGRRGGGVGEGDGEKRERKKKHDYVWYGFGWMGGGMGTKRGLSVKGG